MLLPYGMPIVPIPSSAMIMKELRIMFNAHHVSHHVKHLNVNLQFRSVSIQNCSSPQPVESWFE